MGEFTCGFSDEQESLRADPMIEKKQVDAPFGRPRIASQIQRKLDQINWEMARSKLLGVVCALLLGGLLVVGLWPFHSPRNRVTWFAGGNGLYFGGHGTILSSGKFQAANAPGDGPCSLEIWFEPARTAASGTLFAFYTPGNPRQFSLHQSISDLALQSDLREGGYRTLTTRLYVDDIFHRGKPLFVTVTAKGGQTSVYVDGALARSAPKFPLSSRDFEGELVIANFPKIDNSWSGLLRGLAFYDEEISPAQVLHHYQTWIEKGRPDVSQNDRAVALYLFDERAGRVIHNQVASGSDLFIPDRYLVLDQTLLCPFWVAYSPTWSYWDDVLVNIAGFVPFGFLFCAYFSLVGRIKKPALLAILLGFTVSVTIESLQSFLPTRKSDTTDVITNTLGTCFGAWLYGLKLWRVLLTRVWTHLGGTTARDSDVR
jgi:VanZ family protein